MPLYRVDALQLMTYNAPFFTTWFCTNWTVLFFPLYFFCQLGSPNYQTPTDILGESVRNFRDRGFTAAHFLTRCCMFCMLWVFTNYLYIHALSILVATDALALFAINVCCVYLLSWVILHDQFVGVRVSVSWLPSRPPLPATIIRKTENLQGTCVWGVGLRRRRRGGRR